MQLIFERLGFADFERARSVCSSWLSDDSNPEKKNYCLLLNPEDKEEKLYKTHHLGDDFADSLCLATCGSWLLMDPNYLVIGDTLVYLKKSYNSWKQISERLSGIRDMVFKDHKQFCLTIDELCVFDFSGGESPLQVSGVSLGGGCVKLQKITRIRLPRIPLPVQEVRRRNNVVVTLRGHVLIVRSKSPFMSETWNFRIFKMDSSDGKIKWEKIFSLGDEAIILDLGITVLAKDLEGVTSNSIYFAAHEINWYDTEIFVFHLDTKKVEQLPQLFSSTVSFYEAHWFLPSFRND
ncbi:hypothetical protein BRARA_C04593 [Brassica rapa]|uniref:KIB1-4 beta-propeller domain-containing protein n=2 Tax=Brassica campestris TaxID=3711 RepID=A0A398A7S8_BRACM|nr:hypothetical protein BRARA_C04593 [Brassica rapa]